MIKPEIGHRERLRKRYINSGLSGFNNYEIVELLLTYSIARKDVKPIAKELINKFGTIEEIVKTDIDSLLKIDGIGENSAIFLKLIGEVALDLYHEKINNKEILNIKNKNDLLAYLRGSIGYSNREEFKILFLDSSNNLISTETLFYGTIDKSAIYPREIVERVIKNKAKSIIFIHNHPSGNASPSKKDIELTKYMYNSLNLLEIRLLDHIIITKNSHFSFLEEGLI